MPQIKKIEYGSDGCPGQCKNCSNLYNLCQHKKNFGIDAKWIFFATSHGKSTCNIIGGTIKRNTSKERLRREFDNQIMNVSRIHEFCEHHLPTIKTIIIIREELNLERDTTSSIAHTIPGTRNYHDFTPLSNTIIGCKYLSSDESYSLRFNLLKKKAYNWSANTYVSFVISNTWAVGFITAVIKDELIAEISVIQSFSKNT